MTNKDIDTSEGIIDTHLNNTKHNGLWEVPTITDHLKQIFNTDDEDDGEETGSGIYNDSFDLHSTSPVSLGDPLALTLPTLNFATPQHEFSRLDSLSRESISEFDKFIGPSDTMTTPIRASFDMHDELQNLIQDTSVDKLLKSPTPVLQPTINLENILALETKVNDDQFENIICSTMGNLNDGRGPHPLSPKSVAMSPEAISALYPDISLPRLDPKSVALSPTPATVSDPSSRAPLADRTVPPLVQYPRMSKPMESSNDVSLRNLDPRTATKTDIVERLNSLINNNDERVSRGLSRVEAKKPGRRSPPSFPKKLPVRSRIKSGPKHILPKPQQNGQPSAPHTGTSDGRSNPGTTGHQPQLGSKSQPVHHSQPISKSQPVHHSQPTSKSHSVTSKPATFVVGQNNPPSAAAASAGKNPLFAKPTISTSQPKLTAKRPIITTSNRKSLNSNIDVANLSKTNKRRGLADIKAVMEVKKNIQNNNVSNKITSSSLKNMPAVGKTSEQVLVPYNSNNTPSIPSTSNPAENKKYLLVPLERLQNVSPALISQLGIQANTIKSVKRSIESPSTPVSEKRPKTDSFPSDSFKSFTEKTQFPIKVDLPNSMKDKFREFPESIPEMMDKAKAKRKAQRTGYSAFNLMDKFIAQFIQQNNEQVVEILFLKENNKDLNEKYNRLSKLLHQKSSEQRKLKEDVERLKIENKKMEKELKLIKDMIKKYMELK